MIGEHFGAWEVIADLGHFECPNGDRRKKWLCRCKCGREKDHWSNSLMSKSGSRQCKACANRSLDKFSVVGGITSSVWYCITINAKNRRHKVTVDQQYVWDLLVAQEFRCALTGREIWLPKKQSEKNASTASLDRIDSLLGYVKGNLQWVHKSVNLMKNTLPEKEFLSICREVVEHSIDFSRKIC